MKTGLDKLDKATRILGMQTIAAAAAGQKPWVSLVDGLTNISGDELKDAMTAADSKASGDPGNNTLRMEAAYAFAVYRDYLYGMAAGRYPYALGVHQSLRGLYEGGKMHIDASATA